MEKKFFEIQSQSKLSKARCGYLNLNRGRIATPVFMTIGTAGSVKGLSYADLEILESPIILGNTYHLWLKPGMQVINQVSGLHNFIHWNKPILTDSGGFQAWSLSKIRKFTEQGVTFRSHLNGEKRFLSPEISMQIQTMLGSDIALVLDQVVNAESDKRTAKYAMERTYRWAVRSKLEFERLKKEKPVLNSKQLDPSLKDETFNTKNIPDNRVLFGIPQGAQYPDLRRQSAELTMSLDFLGYSIGGVAQGGEPEEVMYQQVLNQTELLEDHKPRHLLGVGTPKDILEMVKRGVDMFDCVYPTRNARHGSLFLWFDKANFTYETIKIESKRFELDFSPINEMSRFKELQVYSKAYLRHLFRAKELLAYRLATLHNLEFYYDLMLEIREQIQNGKI